MNGEELLDKIGEPDNFWAKLKRFIGQQPGVQAGIPPGLQAVYGQAQPVWKPFGKLTPEEKERAGLTLEQRQKAAGIFMFPEAVISNIAYKSLQPMEFGQRLAPNWKDFKNSVRDAAEGKRYGSFWDVYKFAVLSPEAQQAYSILVENVPAYKVGETVADIGSDLVASIIIEAGMYKAATGVVRGVRGGAAGLRGVIKGMFDDVSPAILTVSFDDAFDEAMEKKQIFIKALEHLRSKKFAGVEGVATWADIANDIMEYAAEEGMVIRGIWPARPTGQQIDDIAKHFGVKIKKVSGGSAFGGQYTHGRRLIELGEESVYGGKGLQHSDIYKFPGDIVLHELGHDIFDQLPEHLQKRWNELYHNTMLDIEKSFEEYIPGYVRTRRYIGTKYAQTNELEMFAETFFLINSRQAQRVPEKIAYEYIDIMREAGVPYVDLKDIVKRSVRNEFIAKLTKERYIDPKEVQIIAKHYVGARNVQSVDELTDEQFDVLVERLRRTAARRYMESTPVFQDKLDYMTSLKSYISDFGAEVITLEEVDKIFKSVTGGRLSYTNFTTVPGDFTLDELTKAYQRISNIVSRRLGV